MTQPAGISLYLQEARSWETDRLREIERSRQTAWRVASACVVMAVAAACALAALTPLKQVQPYVVRVSEATGMVDLVKALDQGKTNYEEVINKYFAQWYVRYREGYSRELAEDYYRNVGLLSGPQEQQRYFQHFNPANPESPLNQHGNQARVRIRIQSTSFINPHVALVRYTREVERHGQAPQLTHWAATLTFRYLSVPMSEAARAINPLGFQVTEYRNDPDAQSPTVLQTTRDTPRMPQAHRSAAVTLFPPADVSDRPPSP